MEPSSEEKTAAIPATGAGNRAVVEVPVEKIEEILTAAPLENRRELERILFQQRVLATTHRGPLPPPADLERYCALIPNGGDRIMNRHEKQSDHRMETEESMAEAQMQQSNIGQWMGFVLGLAGLGVSGFCIYTGHDAAGATLGGTTLIGLVSVFVAGKTEILQSLARKHPNSSESDEANTLESKRQIKTRQREGADP